MHDFSHNFVKHNGEIMKKEMEKIVFDTTRHTMDIHGRLPVKLGHGHHQCRGSHNRDIKNLIWQKGQTYTKFKTQKF